MISVSVVLGNYFVDPISSVDPSLNFITTSASLLTRLAIGEERFSNSVMRKLPCLHISLTALLIANDSLQGSI
jgi:hypothetical protein